MKMMMRVDEAAFEAGGLEEFPLPGDFAAHEASCFVRETDAEAGAGGRSAPRPAVDRSGDGVVEVEMPADLKRGVGAGEGDGGIGGGLGHHEGGAGELARKMRMEDGIVDFIRHAEVVSDEDYFPGHVDKIFSGKDEMRKAGPNFQILPN